MAKGYLCFVLHSHLPYVRHPEHDDFMEEDWFYEAITETYIPLIQVYDGLLKDSVDFKITMSLSPTLLSMFQDELLQSRYIHHIEKLIELAEKEIHRTKDNPQFNDLAIMYHKRFTEARRLFVDDCQRDLTNAFKRLQDTGKLEIITCCATHGYLPLMEISKASKRAQIKVAVEHYKKIFKRAPQGIWLPECGYNPEDEEILQDAGIKYFFTDTHGVLHGNPRPKYGVYAPVYCKNGVAAFGRDIESSKQVWSANEGYPGDYDYLEFYRDIGFELDYDYIKPYIHKDGIRVNTGMKYYKITGETDHKEPYIFKSAMDKAAQHAANFMFNREKQIEHLFGLMQKEPIIVAPYDTELFGHWWNEGPQWLNFLIRKIYYDQNTVELISASEYLRKHPKNQVVAPSMSSWGWNGYSEVWLEGSNDWIYRHLHKASERMSELVGLYPDTNGLFKRALNQALRELLLAQSSDWAFIMKTGTVVNYANERTKTHILRFTKLYEQLRSNSVDESFLGDIEYKDNIFPDLDYRTHR